MLHVGNGPAATGKGPAMAKKEGTGKLSVDSEGEVDGPSWPNGTHICEVEIDPDTGVTKVVRYTTVDDVGWV